MWCCCSHQLAIAFLLATGLGSLGADLGTDTRMGDSLGLMEGGHVWLAADG